MGSKAKIQHSKSFALATRYAPVENEEKPSSDVDQPGVQKKVPSKALVPIVTPHPTYEANEEGEWKLVTKTVEN